MDENSRKSSKSGERNINIKSSEIDRLKSSLANKNDYANKLNELQDNQLEYLFDRLQSFPISVHRLDFFSNSIPLGAFCYAISFILMGFYESKIFNKPDLFVYLVLLFFGGIGQVTAGLFEYIKSRTFPTVVYLLYGVYFITYFLFNNKYSKNDQFDDLKKIFYGTWAGLSLPIFIGSISTNLVYCVQMFSVLGLFIVKCIGECKDSDILKMKVSGILELVTGFLSLYLCFSQILNEHFKKNILPTIKLKESNEIDINIIQN